MGSGWTCLRNDIRVPEPCHKQVTFQSVEAYHELLPGHDAACRLDAFVVPSPCCQEHSITEAFDYVDPFSAIRRAQQLRFQVICENALHHGDSHVPRNVEEDDVGPTPIHDHVMSTTSTKCGRCIAHMHDDATPARAVLLSSQTDPTITTPTSLQMQQTWVQDLASLVETLGVSLPNSQKKKLTVRSWLVANPNRRKSRIPRLIQLDSDLVV